MADKPRKAVTMDLSGNDYAKVAERNLLFRQDWQKSKTDKLYEVDVDGKVIVTFWLWKDKSELMELVKSGVSDVDVLRITADAIGSAKGKVDGDSKKDYEKLETIAKGRALADLGYLASGEIASFEEMAEYNDFVEQQRQEKVVEATQTFVEAKTLDDLKKAFVASKMMQDPLVVAAKDERKAQLVKAAKPAKKEATDADNQT